MLKPDTVYAVDYTRDSMGVFYGVLHVEYSSTSVEFTYLGNSLNRVWNQPIFLVVKPDRNLITEMGPISEYPEFLV